MKKLATVSCDAALEEEAEVKDEAVGKPVPLEGDSNQK